MGAMKRSPASARRPPRGGGGGGSGGLPGGDGGAGGGGLPGCGDGVGGSGGTGGLPGAKGCISEPSARSSRGVDTSHETGGLPGGVGGGGLQRRGKGHVVEASGGAARGGEYENGTGEIHRGEGGAGSGGILPGSGVGASSLQGDGKIRVDLDGPNRGGGPFSGFLMLVVDSAEEDFEAYKGKIEALGGSIGTGFDYRAATHICVEGDIQPGGRVIWEGDGKVVTTTGWINSCFSQGRLLCIPLKDSSESLLPATSMTPLATNNPTARSCTSDGKPSKHKHGSSRPSSSRRKLNFTCNSGLYHNLLSCDADQRRSESLYDYALRFRTCENSSLPGRDLLESFKLCKMYTKYILGRCYNLMATLHQQTKSLGGLFTSRNFRIYADDTVMLDIPESQLIPYSESEGNSDYTSFVKMVRKEVFHDQAVPMDIVEWLSVMSQGVARCHPNVLSNFIYLMEPFQGFGAFVTMYLQFSSIQSTPGWADLSNALRKYDYWRMPECSLFLKTVAYTDMNGFLVAYEDDIRGLLRLLWNSSKHKAKREIKSFIHMVMADYPELLSDLQMALYKRGYLSHLTLKSH